MNRIKRTLSLLIVPMLALSLCACGKNADPAAAPPENAAAGTAEQAAYDAAVQAVENEFIEVINSDLNDFDESAHPELPLYTAVLCRYPENRWYKAFYDFDGNGTDELLIGAGNDAGKTPVAVYAFDGESMRYLCKEQPLGERASLSCSDGLFIVRGSGGAASGSLMFYRIASDGWSTEIVDVVEYEFDEAGQLNYSSQTGNVDAEAFVGRGPEEADGLGFEPEWSLFYQSGNPAD